MAITVEAAISPAQIGSARKLLREYAGYLNDSLGSEHICLESYESELARLPGDYAPPEGALLLAFSDGEPAGCLALKAISTSRKTYTNEVACEMKRLWVRPACRGSSIGLLLATELIAVARDRGYTAMYLDTIPGAMRAAGSIYQKLGFQAVEQYTENPILSSDAAATVEFFRLSLS